MRWPSLLAVSIVAASLCTLAASPARGQTTPYRSWRKLTTSNGYAPAVYDLERRRIVSFREHLYRFPEPGSETRELAFDLYLGVRRDGQSGWLTDARVDEAGYEPGTGIITTVQRSRDLRITTSYVAPFTVDARALLVVAEIENLGAETEDVSLFSLHNFHLGGGPDRTRAESIRWDPNVGYIESSSDPEGAAGALVVRPLAGLTGRTTGDANPFGLVNAHQRFGIVDDSGIRDDAVSGFEFELAAPGRPLAAGARTQVAFVVGYAATGDVMGLDATLDAFFSGQTPEDLLVRERAAWNQWHRQGVLPAMTSPSETQLARQSAAILRMGQVREPGAPNGQIVASLAPGMWDIAWLRDGLLAVRGLTATAHHAEAEAALDFFIRGPTNDYESYIGRTYGVSVARYYGNGREESDWNARGPNVELDGFGMYLEAAAAHVAAGHDAWLTANRMHIDGQVADVLLDFRDPETGLIDAESSIWESHWTDGGRQRWVYTSGYAALGLSAWADVLDAAGDPTTAARYRTGAQEIVAAMRAHLIDPVSGALASSVEQLRAGDGLFADAQAALILGDATFAPSSATGLATLDFLRDRLFLASTTRRGYRRNDDGDLYDDREWVVIDLGISRALRVAGRTTEADALLAWVIDQAQENFLLVPELFEQNDGRYFGEVPMIGFGAGAVLLALIERSGAAQPPPADAGVSDAAVTDTGGSDVVDGGMPDAESGDVVTDDAGLQPDGDGDGGTNAGTDAGGADDATGVADPDAAVGARPDVGAAADAGTGTEDEGCGCATAIRRDRSGGPLDRDGDHAPSDRNALAVAALCAALVVRRRRPR